MSSREDDKYQLYIDRANSEKDQRKGGRKRKGTDIPVNPRNTLDRFLIRTDTGQPLMPSSSKSGTSRDRTFVKKELENAVKVEKADSFTADAHGSISNPIIIDGSPDRSCVGTGKAQDDLEIIDLTEKNVGSDFDSPIQQKQSGASRQLMLSPGLSPIEFRSGRKRNRLEESLSSSSGDTTDRQDHSRSASGSAETVFDESTEDPAKRRSSHLFACESPDSAVGISTASRKTDSDNDESGSGTDENPEPEKTESSDGSVESPESEKTESSPGSADSPESEKTESSPGSADSPESENAMEGNPEFVENEAEVATFNEERMEDEQAAEDDETSLLRQGATEALNGDSDRSVDSSSDGSLVDFIVPTRTNMESPTDHRFQPETPVKARRKRTMGTRSLTVKRLSMFVDSKDGKNDGGDEQLGTKWSRNPNNGEKDEPQRFSKKDREDSGGGGFGGLGASGGLSDVFQVGRVELCTPPRKDSLLDYEVKEELPDSLSKLDISACSDWAVDEDGVTTLLTPEIEAAKKASVHYHLRKSVADSRSEFQDMHGWQIDAESALQNNRDYLQATEESKNVEKVKMNRLRQNVDRLEEEFLEAQRQFDQQKSVFLEIRAREISAEEEEGSLRTWLEEARSRAETAHEELLQAVRELQEYKEKKFESRKLRRCIVTQTSPEEGLQSDSGLGLSIMNNTDSNGGTFSSPQNTDEHLAAMRCARLDESRYNIQQEAERIAGSQNVDITLAPLQVRTEMYTDAMNPSGASQQTYETLERLVVSGEIWTEKEEIGNEDADVVAESGMGKE